MNKKYLTIKEASKLLNIKEHVIRYWDSENPKTKKIRIEGISTKSKGGTRYFSKENLTKLEKLKNLIYDNGNHNHSLEIANKFISNNKLSSNLHNIDNFTPNHRYPKKPEKVIQILKKMRILINKE